MPGDHSVRKTHPQVLRPRPRQSFCDSQALHSAGLRVVGTTCHPLGFQGMNSAMGASERRTSQSQLSSQAHHFSIIPPGQQGERSACGAGEVGAEGSSGLSGMGGEAATQPCKPQEASACCSALSWKGKAGWPSEVTTSFNASFRWPGALVRGPGACEAQLRACQGR